MAELHSWVVDRLRRAVAALEADDEELAAEVVLDKQEFAVRRRRLIAHLMRRLRADEPNRIRSYEREVEVVGQLHRITGLTSHFARLLAGEEQLPDEGTLRGES